MKFIQNGTLFSILFLSVISCKPHEEAAIVRQEIENVLIDNILRVWFPKIVDTVDGGFYSNFDAGWNRMPVQEKFIVTQARGIWTASQAARLYPDDDRYMLAAK